MGSRACLDDLEGSKMSLPHRVSNRSLSDLHPNHYKDFPFRKGERRRRMKLICKFVFVRVRVNVSCMFEPTGRLL
jgi:hypothetical protein